MCVSKNERGKVHCILVEFGILLNWNNYLKKTKTCNGAKPKIHAYVIVDALIKRNKSKIIEFGGIMQSTKIELFFYLKLCLLTFQSDKFIFEANTFHNLVKS